MATRLEMQAFLAALVTDVDGHVYFQPPDTITMQYPAIVYNRDRPDVDFADNKVYYSVPRWQVTVIDRDPDSPIPDRVANLSMSTFQRHFTTEGLNHDIFQVYY